MSKVYQLPDLPYDYAALQPVLSSEILELHHDKHHAGYVKGSNKTLQALAEMREGDDFGRLNQLQKDLAFNISGHVLHSIFWTNMTPNGGGEPDDALAAAMQRDFGSVDAFRAQMTRAALGVQGSGWAALTHEPLGDRLVVEQILDHQDHRAGYAQPLLVLDMWEHAYYLQYRNEKKRWVKAFWDIVNWNDVAERFAAARK